MAYSPKNAVGLTGMGGPNPLSGEQVIQGVMNPTANALNTALVDSSGNPITPTNPIPVTPAAATGATFTSAAAQTITAGATAQTVFAANTARTYCFVLNTSDTIMYLEVTGSTATNTSIPLAAATSGVGGGYYEPLVAPTSAISILCATTGKAFVAKQA